MSRVLSLSAALVAVLAVDLAASAGQRSTRVRNGPTHQGVNGTGPMHGSQGATHRQSYYRPYPSRVGGSSRYDYHGGRGSSYGRHGNHGGHERHGHGSYTGRLGFGLGFGLGYGSGYANGYYGPDYYGGGYGYGYGFPQSTYLGPTYFPPVHGYRAFPYPYNNGEILVAPGNTIQPSPLRQPLLEPLAPAAPLQGVDPLDERLRLLQELENDGPPALADPERLVQRSSPDARLKSVQAQIRGDGWFRKQEYQRALRRYKTAVDEADDRAAAHFRLGYAYLALDRFEKALNHMKRGLHVDPGYVSTGDDLDAVWGPDNGIAKVTARDRVVKWASEDIKNPDRLFLLGVLLFFDGDRERAEVLFKTAKMFSNAGDQSHLSAFLNPPPIQAEPEPEQPVDQKPEENPLLVPLAPVNQGPELTPRP